VDLDLERQTGDFVRTLIASGQVRTVHDLSDGGLAAAAAEMALASAVGVSLRVKSEAHAHVLLFAEDQARYLVAVADPDPVFAAAAKAGVHASVIGEAGGDSFSAPGLFDIPLRRLHEAHEGWLPAYMGG
jgi:phosphoribosylformylglycinamidine synthase subunit PurL